MSGEVTKTWLEDIQERIVAATNADFKDVVESIEVKKKNNITVITNAEASKKSYTKVGDVENALKQQAIIVEKEKELSVLKQYEKELEYITPMHVGDYSHFSSEIVDHYSTELLAKYRSLQTAIESTKSIVLEIHELIDEESDVHGMLTDSADASKNRFAGFHIHRIRPILDEVFINESISSLTTQIAYEIEGLEG